MNHQNIILLTGLPRSGTTLSCKLLNLVPNTVALAEPMNVQNFRKCEDVSGKLALIESFGQTQRATLLESGVAITKHRNGVLIDNFRDPSSGSNGGQLMREEHGTVRFEQDLDENFRLVIKHPAAFSALLPDLIHSFPSFAIVRSPAAILASWNSLEMAVRRGHSPIAEQLDLALARTLALLDNRFDRQIALLEWYFSQFHRHLVPSNIIRYEDIIASQGRALRVISPAASELAETLSSRNEYPAYDWASLAPLLRRLQRSNGCQWNFYSRDEVCAQMTRLVRSGD